VAVITCSSGTIPQAGRPLGSELTDVLNQSQDGTCMDRVRGGGGGDGGEGLGLSLQRGAAAALDLVGAVGQAAVVRAVLRPDRVRAAQGGVGGDFAASPVPDRLVGVEGGAVGRQPHQPQAQAGRAQVDAPGSPPWSGPLSQMTTRGPGWRARSRRRKATAVAAVLLPATSIVSTSPVSTHTPQE